MLHKLASYSDQLTTRWSSAGAGGDAVARAVAASGNSTAATAVQRAAAAEVDGWRERCVDPKGYYHLTRMPRPLSTYPDVPRAMAERKSMFGGMML